MASTPVETVSAIGGCDSLHALVALQLGDGSVEAAIILVTDADPQVKAEFERQVADYAAAREAGAVDDAAQHHNAVHAASVHAANQTRDRIARVAATAAESLRFRQQLQSDLLAEPHWLRRQPVEAAQLSAEAPAAGCLTESASCTCVFSIPGARCGCRQSGGAEGLTMRRQEQETNNAAAATKIQIQLDAEHEALAARAAMDKELSESAAQTLQYQLVVQERQQRQRVMDTDAAAAEALQKQWEAEIEASDAAAALVIQQQWHLQESAADPYNEAAADDQAREALVQLQPADDATLRDLYHRHHHPSPPPPADELEPTGRQLSESSDLGASDQLADMLQNGDGLADMLAEVLSGLEHQPQELVLRRWARGDGLSGLEHQQSVDEGLSEHEVALVSVERTFDEDTDAQAREHEVCSICMDGYATTSVQVVLSCFHAFHKPCVAQWLKQHQTCPVCKTDLKQVAAGVQMGAHQAHDAQLEGSVNEWEPEFEPVLIRTNGNRSLSPC